METVHKKVTQAYDAMSGEFGYTNKMAAPRVEKVVISVGTGKKSKIDRHVNELVAERLAQITGQKPSMRQAKQSIAGFKIREGDTVGQAVTLRGKRMYGFLDKLIHVALPRTKDFRGIKLSAVDTMGNLTMGIKENSIFPETSDEEIKDVFSMAITIVTTAKNKAEAMKFFEHIGVPFQTVEESKKKKK